MITLENLVGRLGNVPHFRGLPETALSDIVFAGQLLNFSEGSLIFNEGEPSSGLYVLFNGQVHLVKLGLHGQETIVARINPVIMFNEVPTIDGGPNAVTAKAALDCTTWQISTERYQMLMERYPAMGTGLLRVLAARNRLLFNRYEDLLSLPVIARVAKVMLDLSQMGEKPINRSRYTNQQIAALAATVPEAVSRSIKSLRETGMLESSRSKITILTPDTLADMAFVEPIDFS
jgi:CRP-like cAMP-binding protein